MREDCRRQAGPPDHQKGGCGGETAAGTIGGRRIIAGPGGLRLPNNAEGRALARLILGRNPMAGSAAHIQLEYSTQLRFQLSDLANLVAAMLDLSHDDDPAYMELRSCGIKDPTARKLAADPSISADVVRREYLDIVKAGNAHNVSGVLVARLRNHSHLAGGGGYDG